MHYYSFHIGDYRAATAHLSNEEDLAFRRLLDMYYDTEEPIPDDTQWVARRLRVGLDVVVSVLNDMFVYGEDGWRHSRCDAEIAHYHELAAKNRENGKKGGRPKKPSGLPVETDSEPKKTLTNNQEPVTSNQKPKKQRSPAAVCPVDVDENVWQDYLVIRKAKKLPVTETALDDIRAEALLAGMTLDKAIRECVIRGWAGFKAKWLVEKMTAAEQRLNTMHQLTGGITTPKNFWDKPTVIEVQDVERKRLL